MSRATEKTNEARARLRGCMRRYARMRMHGERLPAQVAWAERQLLFSLVHEMVCQCRDYDPALDAWLRWACWYLRFCEDHGHPAFPGEDAMLLLILGNEYAEPRTGAWGDKDFDDGDDVRYDERV